MELTTQQRRSAILKELVHHRTVTIADLSSQMCVSEVLIRRDLERLRQQGLLKRVRGGAIALPGSGATSADPRVIPHLDEKERIGRAAAALIRQGDRLIFDSGSTTTEVARHIPGDLLASGGLTAITPSLPIAQEIGRWRGVHVILLGGVYLPDYQIVVGPQAIENIKGLHADKVFVGTDGLTLENGLTTANVLEAEVDRALIRSATQVIAVSDSSKIGRTGLAAVVPFSDIDVLVTDTAAPTEFVSAVREQGTQVIVV